MRTKAVPRRALSPAMRMSQARARLRPAPAAGPLIMAIVGLGISCSSREASSLRRRRVTGSSCGSVSPEAMPAISPPAQKPRPAPVRTRQRASLSSATFWMTPGSMSRSSPLRAFSLSGRFSVIVAMPSEMSSRMMLDVVVISGLLLEPAPIIWQRERLEKAAWSCARLYNASPRCCRQQPQIAQEAPMLTRLDRMLLAVRDREAAADTFCDILGAERVREDTSPLLGARRAVVQAGISEFELLEPAGDGPVAAQMERWGEGIFAAGFATADVQALAARLSERGIEHSEENGLLFIAAGQTPGMNTVISPDAERSPVGLIKCLYEVTNIVDDHARAAAFYAGIFGLDDSRFSPIHSERYGYTGTLTLFNPPQQLDRIELTQ